MLNDIKIFEKISEIDTQMVKMLNGTTAIDRKWLTRIILKKMNLKLGHEKIMELYHPKAKDLYNQYSHLSRVCHAIESGASLDDLSIELLKPIRPQLCARAKLSEINRLLQNNDYYLETKMDGERIHIHINGREFKYFSRSCNDDSTKIFGADSSAGLFSPLLYKLSRGKIDNAILDGEMMVWSRDEEIFLKKGTVTRVNTA